MVTNGVLVWINVYTKTILLAFNEDTNSVIHKFIVILLPENQRLTLNTNSEWKTYGPACSRASQVTGNLKRLNPHPLSLDKCSSADPSSKFRGWPVNDSPPFSAVFQKFLRRCEGWSRGALLEPDRFTPRR